MQRITDPTASATIVAPPTLSGPAGYFTGGVPGVSPATRVRYWWLTQFQESLMAILAAGGVAPDTTGTNFTLLLEAINNLIASGTAGSIFAASSGNIMGSRAFGTVFTNSTGKPMFVAATGISAGSAVNLTFLLEGVVAAEFGVPNAGAECFVCCVVPPGDTYEITGPSITEQTWIEVV